MSKRGRIAHAMLAGMLVTSTPTGCCHVQGLPSHAPRSDRSALILSEKQLEIIARPVAEYRTYLELGRQAAWERDAVAARLFEQRLSRLEKAASNLERLGGSGGKRAPEWTRAAQDFIEQMPSVMPPASKSSARSKGDSLASVLRQKEGEVLQIIDPAIRRRMSEETTIAMFLDGELSLVDLQGVDVGLALSGGSLHGSFEAGFLGRALGSNGLGRPAAISGTSVGAINAFAVSRFDSAGPRELARQWLSLRERYDFFEKTPEHDTVALGLSVEDLLLDPTRSPRPPANCHWVADIFTLGTCDPISGVTQDIEEAIRVAGVVPTLLRGMKSLYTLAPTARRLAEAYDRSTAFHIPYAATSVDMLTGDLVVYSSAGKLVRFSSTPNEDRAATSNSFSMIPRRDLALRGVLGSAAIPGLFDPQLVSDGVTSMVLADGGIRDDVPYYALQQAKSIWGPSAETVRVVIGVRTSPPPHPTPVEAQAEAMWILRLASGLITAVDENGRTDRLETEIPLLEMRPDVYVHDAQRVQDGLIRINLDYGYMLTDMAMGSTKQSWATALIGFALVQDVVAQRRNCFVAEHYLTTIGPWCPVIDPLNQGDCSRLMESLRDDWLPSKRNVRNDLEMLVDIYGEDLIPRYYDGVELPDGRIVSHEDIWLNFETYVGFAARNAPFMPRASQL